MVIMALEIYTHAEMDFRGLNEELHGDADRIPADVRAADMRYSVEIGSDPNPAE
jgi:hypothetical protein